MTDQDGGERDDRLEAMRAVWLAMPDQEPPQRGMAELLAAARVQAEEMATPSTWRRFLDLLRRPPVLALASVMVLLGGAIFVVQRREKLEHRATAPTAEAPVATSSAPPSVGQPPRREAAPMAGPTDGAGAVAASPDGSTAAGAPAVKRPADSTQRSPANAPVERPTRGRLPGAGSSAGAVGAGEESGDALRRLDTNELSNGDAKTSSGVRFGEDEGGVVGGKEIAEPEIQKADPDSAGEKAGSTASLSASPEASPPPEPTRSPARVSPSGASAAQLHAQARSSAARGDCAAVRTVSKRIEKLDARYHREHVVGDKQLARCASPD